MTSRFRALLGLVALLFSSVLWFPSSAGAATCAINGGTKLGCFLAPLHYRTSYDNSSPQTPTVYPDLVSGVYAVADYNMHRTTGPRCPECTYGLATSNINQHMPAGSLCTSRGILSPCDPRYPTFTDVSDGHPRHGQVAVIWGLQYDPPHNTPHYYFMVEGGAGVEAECPSGTSTLYDYPTGRGDLIDLYCAPTATWDAGYARQDSNREGGSCGLNPIDLPSRAKLDRVVDYTSSAPFPIVWERFYNGQVGDWVFSYDRKLSFQTEGPSTQSVIAHRADGSTVLFTAPWTAGSTLPDAWAPATTNGYGSHATLIQSTLTDTKDGLGNIATFVLTTPDDIQEHYDGSGKLVYLEDRNGNQIGFAHDAKGRVSQVVDDFGHQLNVTYTSVVPLSTTYTFATYDPTNATPPPPDTSVSSAYYPGISDERVQERVAQIDDGTRTVSYTYTPAANPSNAADVTTLLTTVTPSDADGSTAYTYGVGGTYGAPLGGTSTSTPTYNMLTSIVDESANEWANYYYSGNQASSASHGHGLWQNYTFGTTNGDGVGNTFQFSTDGWAHKTTGYLTACPTSVCGGGWGTQARSITYNTYGNPTSVLWQNYNTPVVGGPTTTRTYDDPRGLPLTQTDASGTALARTTTWTWDPTFHLPLTQVDPIQVGGTSGTRTTTWTRDSHGNATSIVVHTTTGEPDRTWSATFDGAGNVLTATDPLSHTTTYTYQPDGRLASTTDALAHTTTVDGYTARGAPTQWTDANGLVVKVTYDAHDRPIQVDRGSAGTHWETALLGYTPTDFLADLTSPDGRQIHFRYDAAHRLAGVDLKDTAGALLGTIDYTMDRRSLKTAEVWKDAAGTTVQSRTATYDALSRLATEVGAAQPGETTTYSYDPQSNLNQVQDALVHKTKQTYDALGRALVTTDALNHTATLAYDVGDQVVSATDPNGHATTYAYNGFGELTQLVSPDSGTRSFTVDGGGRRATTTDPRGVVTTITYDALDRPTQVVYSDAGVAGSLAGFTYGSETQTFTYDSCSNGIGHLCSMTDGSGTTGYTYDLWGRVTGKTFTPAGSAVALTVGYTYDSQGRLTTLTYPSGKSVTLGRDSASRVASLAYDGQTVVQSIAYRPVGDEVTGWSWGAAPAGTVAFHYDLDGRVSEIDDADTRTYTYDVAGRLTGINDPVNTAAIQVYGYDVLDRLTSANLGSYMSPISYTYDNTGNRLTNTDGAGTGTAHTITWTVASTSNRVTAEKVGTAAATTWTVDATGNLINDGAGLTLSYDAKNRLASTVNGGGTTLYAHNAAGQRTEKAGPLGTELYAYDEAGRLLGVYDAAGNVVEELVYLDGWRPVATVRVAGGTSTVYPILTDHLGTPRKVLDPATGSALWSWDAKEAFGNQASTGPLTFQARFPGQRFDPETGLVANGFRVYSAVAGRYIQSDPLGLKAGWSTFAYTESAPETGTDPNGLQLNKTWDDPYVKSLLRYARAHSRTAAIVIDNAIDDRRVLGLSYLDNDTPLLNLKSTEYDPRTQTVKWNQNTGILCGSAHNVNSPVLLLLHEIVHFNQWAVPSVARGKMLQKRDDGYTNDLEQDAIEVEAQIARELGEYPRTSHQLNPGDEPVYFSPDFYSRY